MKKSNVSFIFPLIILIVYFRIFDVNKDKKIDHDDLKKVMKMLFGSKLTASEL